MGDFYCTGSDNGKLTGFVVPIEAAAELEHINCIGIVIYTGLHAKDNSDYTIQLSSTSALPDGTVHGYVMALTDANNGSSDRLRWEWGPGNVYNRRVEGINTSDYDWSGYSNALAFHTFVNANSGWEMKHFPAALACETYGMRTVDNNGNTTNQYAWQAALAAPANSSGWFLPTVDHFRYLDMHSGLLGNSFRLAAENAVGQSHAGYIKWPSSDYWSSTETTLDHYAWYKPINNAMNISSGDKNRSFNARAILAF